MSIREALDTYPLAHWLRRGAMDLRPSLARHLEDALPQNPSAESGPPVRVLVAQLDKLISEWRQQSFQLPDDGNLSTGVRKLVLQECASELDRLLNEGKPL